MFCEKIIYRISPTTGRNVSTSTHARVDSGFFLSIKIMAIMIRMFTAAIAAASPVVVSNGVNNTIINLSTFLLVN